MRIRFSRHILIAIIAIVGTFETARASSCCGGGFASPSIITGDERATVSAEFSYSNVATEVSSQGIWQDRHSPETLQTFKLQGAHIFADRFQVGAGIPMVSRARAGSSSTGLGDASVSLGYETLPEWDYSPWRPRGVSYLSLTLPTGRAIQDATEFYQLDARGRGFWAIGLGTTLTKIIGHFDFVTTLEIHRSFAREFRNAAIEGTLSPGFGGLWSIGTGYNFPYSILKDTRLGANLAFNYEDPIETQSNVINSVGSPMRFATATVSVSQMFGEAWAVSLSAFDQTLFGAPANTSLARGATITAQHRFSR